MKKDKTSTDILTPLSVDYDLKFVPLEQLEIPHDARDTEDDNSLKLKELTDSIRLKGVLQAITITPDNKILSGRRRYRAAKALNLAEIPCLVRPISDNLDSLEVELFENIHRKNLEWHEEVRLQKEIHLLMRDKHGEDWTEVKTAKLINKSPSHLNENLQIADIMEKAPTLKSAKDRNTALRMIKGAKKTVIRNEAVEEFKAKSTDTNILSKAESGFKVMDAFELMDSMIEAYGDAPGVASFIEVDPPYAIDIHEQKRGKNVSKSYKEIDKSEYPAWIMRLCSKLYRVAAPNAWVVFWFGIEWYQEVLTGLRLAGFQVDLIPAIWSKGVGQTNAPNINLARTYESFFIARKGNSALSKPGRSNVFNYAPVPSSAKYHPTQRPIELMEDILDTFSEPGSIVFIPFLGSGVTLRACYRKHRSGFGADLAQKNKDGFLAEVMKDIKLMASDTEE